MKLRMNIILWLVPVLFLFNCTRSGIPPNEDPHVVNLNDTIFPVININKPLADQVFTNSETIIIEGKVTDQGLYRGNIQILNAANNTIVKEQAYEIHGLPEYNFNLSHVTSVSSISDYTITVWFEDHGLNTTTKTIKVKVNP
jgi:hypothetical protein